MASREEIREGITKLLELPLTLRGISTVDECEFPQMMHEAQLERAQEIINFLHSQGVVIKVDRELPDNAIDYITEDRLNCYFEGRKVMVDAGLVAVESLIKEER